jgi:hypothetical protein
MRGILASEKQRNWINNQSWVGEMQGGYTSAQVLFLFYIYFWHFKPPNLPEQLLFLYCFFY